MKQRLVFVGISSCVFDTASCWFTACVTMFAAGDADNAVSRKLLWYSKASKNKLRPQQSLDLEFMTKMEGPMSVLQLSACDRASKTPGLAYENDSN